jgi:hypothetical protein
VAGEVTDQTAMVIGQTNLRLILPRVGSTAPTPAKRTPGWLLPEGSSLNRNVRERVQSRRNHRFRENHMLKSPFSRGVSRVRLNASAIFFIASAWVG